MCPEPSKIQQEIKQDKPFRSTRQEAVLALLRTADVVRHYFNSVLKPHGITLQQYNVLRILRGADDGGLPTLEIAERMVERTPGVTRLVDRIEKKGLVERQRSQEDRRKVLCQVTDRGLDLLARMDEEVDAADRRALGDLDRAEVRELVELLDGVRDAHGE